MYRVYLIFGAVAVQRGKFDRKLVWQAFIMVRPKVYVRAVVVAVVLSICSILQ